ncbi:hypothetical protein GCM10027051_31200 [Niabella terrae]
MKLRVVGEFNKISEEMQAAYPGLQKGERAIFKLLGGHTNPLNGEVLHGSYRSFKCVDRVVDIGTGALVEIGIPKLISGKEVTEVKKFVMNPSGEGLVPERFELNGDKIEHQEFFQFFVMSNICGSNPNRDESVRARFVQIDEKAESRARSEKRNALRQALLAVEGLTAGQVRALNASMNGSLTISPDAMRLKLEEYAETHPAEFLKRYGSPELQKAALLKEAETQKTIRFDHVRYAFVWGKSGNVIAKLEKEEGKNELDLFVDWLQTKNNGESIYHDIEAAFEAEGGKPVEVIKKQPDYAKAKPVDEEADEQPEPESEPAKATKGKGKGKAKVAEAVEDVGDDNDDI